MKRVNAISILILTAALAVLAYGNLSTLKNLFRVQSATVIVRQNTIDLGKIYMDDNASGEFVIVNQGQSEFEIDEISEDCQCTSSLLSKKTIAPGDSAIIIVEYDKNRFGFFQKNATVFSKELADPILLTIQGFIMLPQESVIGK